MPPQMKYDIISEIAKRRGFYWPSFEIYGGLSGFTTYGDLGTKLKENIKTLWKEYFVRKQGFLEIEDPIINPERVFIASGHLDNFKEYSSECTKCGKSFRADHLIEEKTGIENVESLGGDVIANLLLEHNISCPECGGQLNVPNLILTMFKTKIGVKGGVTGYARPETAQAMFMNYKRVFHHNREKLPFAIAQTSKALRNEISPRQGMIRLREFTIMELELFFDPEKPKCPWFKDVKNTTIKLFSEEMVKQTCNKSIEVSINEAVKEELIATEWQGYFMGLSQLFINTLGVPDEKQRFRAHLLDERAHYSKQTYDHEVKLESWGWTEVSGCAFRTDFDLKNHMEASGIDMTVLREDGTRFIPYVVEPSYGLDRLMYVTLETNYERKNKRNIFHLTRELAPYQVAVLPLVSKDGISEKAQKIRNMLIQKGFWVTYDEKGSIGRRYARSDEIGTPLAITVDYDTRNIDVLTIRDRDSWKQVKTTVQELPSDLEAYFKYETNFNKLGEPFNRG